MDGFEIIEKEVEQLVSIFHNKYLMSDKRIAFFGDTNKVMFLDLKKNDWVIKTINNNSNHHYMHSIIKTVSNDDLWSIASR